MERRKNPTQLSQKTHGPLARLQRSSALPAEYCKLAEEVFSATFQEVLKELSTDLKRAPRFSVTGGVFHDEILLQVSLLRSGEMAAMTFAVSQDYDPAASQPKAEDLLADAVDLAGSFFESLFLDPISKQREALFDLALDEFDAVAPLVWSEVQSPQGRKVFLKFDRSNPELDAAADHWLEKNDPALQAEVEETEVKSKDLFKS
jgi:hypothetical protein